MPHFNSLEQFQSVSDKGKLIEVKVFLVTVSNAHLISVY
jgi:hypothetical protein